MTSVVTPEVEQSTREHPLAFKSSLEHVLAEIAWVEQLVRLEIDRMGEPDHSDAALKGLVISDKEVAAILQAHNGSPPFAAQRTRAHDGTLNTATALRRGIDQRCAATPLREVELRLQTLRRVFNLSEFEMGSVIICLALEVDRRFERLFAYLQDDVTSRYVSADLALNLLCVTLEEKLEQRERFASGSTLPQHHLLLPVDEGSQNTRPWLGRPLRMDERIVRFLLGSDMVDARIAGCTKHVSPTVSLDDVPVAANVKGKLLTLAKGSSGSDLPFIHLRGTYGCGQRALAEALCRELETTLVVIDLEALLSGGAADAVHSFRLSVREAVLCTSAVFVHGFELVLADDKQTLRRALLQEASHAPGLVFVDAESTWHPRDECGTRHFISVHLDRPEISHRIELLRAELKPEAFADNQLAEIANKFHLTGGQIADAVRSARQFARWKDPVSGHVSLADVYEACRVHSSHKLSTLGRKIKPHYTWDDLVLAEDKAQHLREICNCVKYRSLVFDTWGFDKKLSLGKGLNMLFAGPSGTGKTMAAEIMASELGLDVYKIDLSSMVSKYIGETEKNLARIFSEAESSNAILFFDEADALFGKRSEVRDSHDRYANIEINYLLQKMEEHEGIVILATNFRKNMDDAFVRRLHFTMEFPLPGAADRRRIWERIWPKETPQVADLDFEYMAHKFEMAGGNIRNVAMAAAFLAASNGGVVTMKHLLHGTRREYQKMGRVVSHGEFE